MLNFKFAKVNLRGLNSHYVKFLNRKEYTFFKKVKLIEQYFEMFFNYSPNHIYKNNSLGVPFDMTAFVYEL